MAVTPHFVFPLRIDGSGHIATVEQDTPEDVMSCVFVALKTPRGSRPFLPDFGVDDYTFGTGELQLAELEQQIVDSEPRADLALSDEIRYLIQKVTVGVGNVG